MRECPPRDTEHAPTHVLMMDDSPVMLDLLQEILEDEGNAVLGGVLSAARGASTGDAPTLTVR